jgi:hypothetical protein
MRPTKDHVPFAIRVWRIANVIHASIPRTVVRTPTVIDHRRDSVDRPPGDRELYDLALNVLNVFMEPRYGARGELEPVKCFRGQCSSFAARHHIEFAREFLRPLPDEGGVLSTAKISAWIEQRQRAACELADAESYLDEALTA